MAEWLATTPHATRPILRSEAQKAHSQGCSSRLAPEVEGGTDRTGDTTVLRELGESPIPGDMLSGLGH